MRAEYYAHSAEGKPVSEWHRLHDHLLNVASLAKGFAEAFNSDDRAYMAGLWHDLGKCSADFQGPLSITRDNIVRNKAGR